MSKLLIMLSFVLVVLTFPFSLFWCLQVLTSIVQEYERVVVFRLGRLMKTGTKGPGIFFILPCLDVLTTVDLRTVSCDVPTQEVSFYDSKIDPNKLSTVTYFLISDPMDSITNVENVRGSTQLLAQTTLRNVLGTKTLTELLGQREQIKQYLEDNLGPATKEWGVFVERVEVKDMRLPLSLQRVMAAEAESARSARARMIRAEGEHQAALSLRQAADTVAKSPYAVHLRYLQTLSKISGDDAHTVVLPVPTDFIKRFLPLHVKKRCNIAIE